MSASREKFEANPPKPYAAASGASTPSLQAAKPSSEDEAALDKRMKESLNRGTQLAAHSFQSRSCQSVISVYTVPPRAHPSELQCSTTFPHTLDTNYVIVRKTWR